MAPKLMVSVVKRNECIIPIIMKMNKLELFVLSVSSVLKFVIKEKCQQVFMLNDC